MRELDPGTDLHAAVLAIAPPSWDDDLTTATPVDQALRQLAIDFPLWLMWRPRSPDGERQWWGARTDEEVLITGTEAELRDALTRHRDTGRHSASTQVIFLEQRGM